MDQNAVVAIERHHIGHRAKRHQIEIIRHIGGAQPLPLIPAKLAQMGVESRHQVEGHPHTGQRLGGEVAAMLVRVDDGIGVRQLLTRQMVIGNQYLHASRLGRRHPGDAGDTVIHRDQELGATGHRQLDNFGGEAVAKLEAIGHQKIDVATAHGAQRQHTERRAGGTVAVEITDNEDPFLSGQGIRQQRYRLLHTIEALGRQQLAGAALQQGRIVYATTGEDLAKQGMQGGRQMGIINSRTTTDLQGHQYDPVS